MSGEPDYEAICRADIGDISYTNIFVQPLFVHFMSVGVPVVSGIGIIGNVLVMWVNQHRKLTGLSILLLNALVLADVMLMVSLILMYLPRGHLASRFTPEDCANGNREFWRSLDYAQRMYVVVHPYMDAAGCLVIWSAFTYVLELYGVFFHPERMAGMTKYKSTGLKILVTVFNLIMIMSLIHFFKFVRRDALYHHMEHKKICLSDVYLDDAYQTYDIYIYFGGLSIFPWVAMFPLLIRIAVEVCERHRDPSLMAQSPRAQVVMLLKEGRSRRTIFTISIMFLVCYAFINAFDIYSLQATGSREREVPCYLMPMDRRYALIHKGNYMELVRVVFILLYSATKFPICYFSGKVFRKIFNTSIIRCSVGVKQSWKDLRNKKVKVQTPSGTTLKREEESNQSNQQQYPSSGVNNLKAAIEHYSQINPLPRSRTLPLARHSQPAQLSSRPRDVHISSSYTSENSTLPRTRPLSVLSPYQTSTLPRPRDYPGKVVPPHTGRASTLPRLGRPWVPGYGSRGATGPASEWSDHWPPFSLLLSPTTYSSPHLYPPPSKIKSNSATKPVVLRPYVYAKPNAMFETSI